MKYALRSGYGFYTSDTTINGRKFGHPVENAQRFDSITDLLLHLQLESNGAGKKHPWGQPAALSFDFKIVRITEGAPKVELTVTPVTDLNERVDGREVRYGFRYKAVPSVGLWDFDRARYRQPGDDEAQTFATVSEAMKKLAAQQWLNFANGMELVRIETVTTPGETVIEEVA